MSKIYKIASNPDSTRFYLSHCFLYPFGNTPASDLTRGCQTNSDINFLLLGCGDIRKILFTIKTLVEEKRKCNTLYFHINDGENVILARNLVLFNILDNIDPENDEDIEFLWSVWYDMAIPKGYYERLLYIIQDLLQNPNLRVEYGTTETEEQIKSVLKYWLEMKISADTAKIMRLMVNRERLENEKSNQIDIIPYQMYQEDNLDKWEKEIHSFIEEGSTYEGALKDPDNLRTNPTLFCPHVNGWRVHPSGTPFHSYNLYGLTEGRSLFHNCLSQLKTMVCAWRQLTSRKDAKIKVILWLEHCLTLCNHTLPADMKFDFIDTSNVVDHMSLLSLLVSCSDRLKPSGMLATETLKGSVMFKSLEHYLNFQIGVPSTFFPIMFNLRLAEDSEMGISEPRHTGLHVGAHRIIIRWLKDGKDAEPIDINGSPDVFKIFKVLIQTCMPMELQDISKNESNRTPSLLIHIVRNMKDNVVGGAKTLLDIIIKSQPSLKTKSGHVFYPYENSLRTTWLAYIDQLGCVWPKGNGDQNIVLLDVEISPIRTVVCGGKTRSVFFGDELEGRGTVIMNSGDCTTMSQHVVLPTEPWFFVTEIAYEIVGKIKLLLPTDVWETLRTSACLAISRFSNSAKQDFGVIAIKENPRVKIADSLQIPYRPMTQEDKRRHLRVTEYEDRYDILLEWHDGLGERTNMKVAHGSGPNELLIGNNSASSRFRFRCPILEIQTMRHDSWTIRATKDLRALNGPLILKYRRLDIGAFPTVTMTFEQVQNIQSTYLTHEKMKKGIETNDPDYNIGRFVQTILEHAMCQHPLKPLLKAYFISINVRHLFGTVSNDIFIHFRKCHMVHGILCLDIIWVDFEKVNQYINEGKITRTEVDSYCDTHGGQSEETYHHFEVPTEEAIRLRKWLILNTMKSKQRQKGQRCQWAFNSFLQPVSVFSINNNYVDDTVLSDMAGKSDTRSNLITKEQVQTKTEKVCSSCACKTPVLKACTRCHTAFYCGKECQKRDWPNHKQSCKSDTRSNLISKEQVQTKTEKVCSSCACKTPELKSCTRCHTAFYCGKECQKRDWPNHKQSCISKNE